MSVPFTGDFSKGESHCVKVRVLTRFSCRPPRRVFDSRKSFKNYGQDIVMAFSPPVVSCLVKKGLQKRGGHGHPRTPWLRPWFLSTLCTSALPDLVNADFAVRRSVFAPSRVNSSSLCPIGPGGGVTSYYFVIQSTTTRKGD